MPGDVGDLQTFAREHHVHYDVMEEKAPGGLDRDLRLFAAHDSGKLGVPACPRCVELLTQLRSFAEQALAREDAAALEFVPEPAALYEPPDDRGKDEVGLTIRFEPTDAAGSGDKGPFQRAVKRLEELGIPRRS